MQMPLLDYKMSSMLIENFWITCIFIPYYDPKI
jgi:hypothetical protein